MIRRILQLAIVAILAGPSSISCSDDISDCPSRMCIVAGGWQLTEAIVDDELFQGDLSQFRLTLASPLPESSPTSAFTRIQTSGLTDEGSWSLENDESILRLVPENNQSLREDWVIASMTPRRMVLIITRDINIKDGPGKIELVLEPF